MPPKASPTIDQSRRSIMDSNDPIIDNLTPFQLESYFLHMLSESNRLSRNDESIGREVAMAKMVNYCIRMLHSNGWVPRTVIRTMVIMEAEAGSDRSVKGMMYQAMREKRDEGRARRAAKAIVESSGRNLDTIEEVDSAQSGGADGEEVVTGVDTAAGGEDETDDKTGGEKTE